MTLIVEDGSGMATAESYISVADADTYIAAYKGADSTWDGATEGAKEIAARQATQYLDGAYHYQGVPETSTQALEWPRSYAYDERGYAYDGLPTKLVNATAEVMFLIVTGETITENVSKTAQTKREKVGDIEVEYVDGATLQPAYPAVNRLLSDLLSHGGSNNRMVRG